MYAKDLHCDNITHLIAGEILSNLWNKFGQIKIIFLIILIFKGNKESDKYVAAKSWGKVVVNLDWVYECSTKKGI